MNYEQTDRRQSVRVPRRSDGVGNALKQVYGSPAAPPADMKRLLDLLMEH